MIELMTDVRGETSGNPVSLVLEYHHYMNEWFPNWDDGDYLDDDGNMVSQQEYEARRSVARQVANLERRYGFVPASIHDYWTGR